MNVYPLSHNPQQTTKNTYQTPTSSATLQRQNSALVLSKQTQRVQQKPVANAIVRDVAITVMVEPQLMQRVQQIVQTTCGHEVLYVCAEPMPRTHNLKLSFQLNRQSIALMMHAIMVGVASAEFGRISAV